MSSTSAVRMVTARPTAPCRSDTARRFSPSAQAIASSASTPNADCSCSMNPPNPALSIMPVPRGSAMPCCEAVTVDKASRSATGLTMSSKMPSAPAICSGTDRSCSFCCRAACRASPARSRRSRSAGRSTTSPAAPSSSAWSGWCNFCPRRCWFSSPATLPTASSASAWCSFASSRKRRRRCSWRGAPMPAGSPRCRSSSPPS